MHDYNKPDLNLMSAYTMMQTKYGITMNADDFLEEAYLAFKDINSIPTKYYYFVRKPDGKDMLTVKLPCNVHRILSVSSAPLNGDDYNDIEPYREHKGQMKDNYDMTRNILSGNSDMKTYLFNDTPKVGLGSYIAYERVDDEHISIADRRLADTDIHIIYEGIAVDEEGLPLITRKHAQAIAAKVAHGVVMKQLFSGNQAVAQLLPLLAQESARLVQAAAIPEHITDNDLDNMLNEHTTFNRKRYNRSFKFRR